MGLTQVSTDGVKSNAINTAKINNGSIQSEDIADNQIITTKILDGAVSLAKLPHGDSNNNGKFLRANNGADPSFETVSTDLVADTSPQLGGNLDTNSNNIDFGDSNSGTVNRLRFGASTDLEIFHNGSHNHIDCHTAGQDLFIRPTKDVYFQDYASDDKLIKMVKDGAVELYHDNSKKFETLTNGVQINGQEFISEGTIVLEKSGAHHHRILANDTGNDLGFQQSSDTGANTNFTTYLRIKDGGDIALPVDNKKLLFGASADLQIYHDGGDNHIDSISSSHKLKIQAEANIEFRRAGANELMALFAPNGAVELYHNNGKRLETTSTGIGVIGVIDAGGSYTASSHEFDNSSQYSWCTKFRNHASGYGLDIRVNDDSSSREGLHIYSTNAGQSKAAILMNGGFLSRADDYAGYSDVKLKDNIVDAKSQWDDVKEIKVRNFNFKDNPDQKLLGVVAQELETVCPSLIHNLPDKETDEETGEIKETGTITKAAKYSILHMKAFKALQEAMARIETLETKVAALEAA